jgi:predicted lactoylglutathione lyase
MQPATIVVALPVTDLDRSLRFYRDGLGLSPAEIDESMIAFELPNLSLFLIPTSEYATYVDRSGIAAPTAPSGGACIISCAIGTKAEVDDALALAASAGGSAPQPAADHEGGYMGYFSDPDGHLWELVSNEQTAAAAAR